MVAKMGFFMLFFKWFQKNFGLFAIRRSDTTNDAMFDPAFVAALLCIVL